jgi:alpha-D-ribose 1-methylphosphonate 5-triphosphate diphosphatase
MLITNARIVTRDEEFVGTLHAVDGRIAALDRGASAVAAAQDWQGDYLIPGLVELHTDNLEKHLAPRPGVRWPALPAVLAHDAQLVAAGITTVLDAVAIGDLNPNTARVDQLQPALDATRAARERGLLRADHLLHIRCELSYPELPALFDSLLREPALRLVSLMDHTPGQRQFVNLEKYREYYQGKHGMSDAEIDTFTERQLDNQRRHSAPNRRAIVARCRERGIPLASHDDATVEHVAEALSEGVAISEFPTTTGAAHAAHTNGLGVLMGAPNVVRGGSHSGNVSALELAHAGLLDGLSSDYVPASLLHAAFLLRERADWSLPSAVATVTANPARMAGLTDRGEISHGKRADFLRVRAHDGIPVVLGCWRGGERIV